MTEKIEIKEMVESLQKIGAIKQGNFLLKSGVSSPVYIDLRILIGYPELLEKMGAILYDLSRELAYDLICGVPYSALPMATAISLVHKIPMCIKRKEKKSYGTARSIEGVYKEGDRVLIIEDVATSGSSIIETALELKEAGLVVTDAVVFLDRGGAAEKLKLAGIALHSALTLERLFEILKV